MKTEMLQHSFSFHEQFYATNLLLVFFCVCSCGTVCYVVQEGSQFWVCGWNPKAFKWKLLSCTFLSRCLFWCTTGLSLWINCLAWPFNVWDTDIPSYFCVVFLEYSLDGRQIWPTKGSHKILVVISESNSSISRKKIENMR